MDVDRASFLFLTSAILASCVTVKDRSSSQPGTPVDIPSQPPQPAPVETAASPRPPPVVAESPRAVEEDDDEAPYEPWPGTADPPLAKTVHGQKCDVAENAKGKAVACAIKAPPGPSCESIGTTRTECARFPRWLVPRVAEKAAACLQTKSGKSDLCLFNIGASCFIESLSSVCVDTSSRVESACTRVMQQCARMDPKSRHMTMDACRAAMSAIVPIQQGKFLSCAAESCDLVPCHYAAQR